MAVVWFVNSEDFQIAFPIARKPLDWCVKSIGLRPENWRADLERQNLTVSRISRTISLKYQLFGYVLVEIDEEDFAASEVGGEWKRGFHVLENESDGIEQHLGL